jgi:signal transduction histidine kinase
MRRLWPRSLAARTAFVLLLGLALVQVAGLTIHALDRIDLQRLGQARDLALRVMILYRAVVMAPPPQREAVLRDLQHPPSLAAELSTGPPATEMRPLPALDQRLIRSDLVLVPVPGLLRPRDIQMFGGEPWHRLLVAMRLPDSLWLSVETDMPPPRPWHSETFLAAFALMTVAAGGLTVWAVRRLTEPVRTLAEAAEALGRDVNAPPLPEDGPNEVATAARAFNTMAARIRRFVQDRTFMVTAIGHDLRTPITRLKLRAEFLEEDELRERILADLEELETMVAATLVFGRDAASGEAVAPLDLAELLRTVLDETGDTRPEAVDRFAYAGLAHLTVRARPVALKRALANLIGNAASYGGAARVTLHAPSQGTVAIDVEDDGPGIPADQLESVFQPFHRLDQSRNRETGGAGLGLPIARNILRAHGGDVTLANREPHGVRARVTLPA